MPDDRELAQRLRAYESRIPDDDPPDPRAIRTARRAGWPKVLAGGVAAAAAIAVVVIGSSLLDRQSTGESSPTASQTAPTLSSAATAPSATPDVTGVPASDVPSADASPDGSSTELRIVMREGTDDTLQYVVGFGHGTAGRVAAVNVKTGATIPATAPWVGNGAIYLETDDGSWQLVDTGATFRDVGFTDLLSPPGLPMVIYGIAADAQPPREITGAWTSTDGQTWTEVDVVPPGGVVAESPLGYVLASVVRPSIDASVIELYRSDDAVSWELVHSVAAGRSAEVDAAGGGQEGFVVAARTDPGNVRQLILASADGRTWFEAPEQPALADDDTVMAVASIGPDWVAAGWRSASEPSTGIDLWSSADGLNWESAGSILPDLGEEAFGTRVMYPSHLLSHGDYLFLSGAFASEGSETRPRSIWTSTDGRAWEEVPIEGHAEVRAVDGIECCIWLGGRLGDDGEAVIWRWDPSGR